ncbi:tetratricopeptide repeat protein, partial [Salmonella enterica]|uniref:tetratricopeptide repeat protein n=1 Tax=Salmonella enterica TaxID=28901 RepID=UPI003CEAACD3
REAYRLLDAGDNDGAEREIDRLLAARPKDGDALGARGVLRLRQMRYGEAEQALRDAQRAKPATAARWNEALKAASFWRHVQAA